MPDRPYISLYTGAGGLDLGLEAAGFTPLLCIEMDRDARATLEANRPLWKLSEPGNIHALTTDALLHQAGSNRGEVLLVAGGPPCQPFSKAGQWANGTPDGLRDYRAKTLDRFFEVVRAAAPEVFLLENVPLIAGRSGEALRHIHRLLAQTNRATSARYRLTILSLRAEQFGVPQMRHRLFLMGVNGDRSFEPPSATFGVQAEMPRVRTAWDAIGDIELSDEETEELAPSGRWADLLPSIPEGGNYEWHTRIGGGVQIFGHRTRYWSFLLKLAKDRPSWTIQAEPGPATGPFHWRSRMLSIRELCRLQTIPDGYQITGDRRAAVRQIGNAVPPALGELLGLEIRRQVLGESGPPRPLSLMPPKRSGLPEPEVVNDVPAKYLSLVAVHSDHPGSGLGPGASKRLSMVTPGTGE